MLFFEGSFSSEKGEGDDFFPGFWSLEEDSEASLGAVMMDSSVKTKFVRICTKNEVAVAIKAACKKAVTTSLSCAIESRTTPK